MHYSERIEAQFNEGFKHLPFVPADATNPHTYDLGWQTYQESHEADYRRGGMANDDPGDIYTIGVMQVARTEREFDLCV